MHRLTGGASVITTLFLASIGVYHRSKLNSLQIVTVILALILSTTLHLNFTLIPKQQRGRTSVGEPLAMYVQIHVISCVWVCSYMYLC